MSFLSEILMQKQRLKETETTVTDAVGHVHTERKCGLEKVEQKTGLKKYGFIVDTKPDDVPALILDHLYVGSQDCTSSTVLEKFEIRNVLSVGIEVYLENVNCKFVPCLDLPETSIEPVIEKCFAFIKEALGKGENVLVHCNAGVSRTSMVAIAYLIVCEGFSFCEAYGLLKAKRPAIQPNVGFMRQLKQLKMSRSYCT